MGVSDESYEDTIEIEPPKTCPYCGSELVREGVHYFCENTLSCKPQMVKSIVHFGSREAMNIESFSEKTAEQLFEKLEIKSIADLYRIKKEELLTLDKFGEKKAQNLIDALEKSKKCTLATFITALGIPNVGKKTALDLAKKFKSLEKLQTASLEELQSISDIGEIVAQSVIEFFKDDKINNSIAELLKLGVKPEYKEEKIIENPFVGKSVVVTGSLINYSRSEIKDKIESLGAKDAASVSKKTDYVLVGKDPGSKYNKALELGIRIISEEEFERMLTDM
jgi:DNA ligase (NAD+)